MEWKLYNVFMEYKNNSNVTYSCKYHVVWCPKYRRKVLIEGVDERLKELIGEIAVKHAAEIIEMEIRPDHVHLVVEVDPQYGIHRFIRQVKGQTSRLLRQEYPWLRSRIPTLWTNSYFVATIGSEPQAQIEQYIELQKHV